MRKLVAVIIAAFFAWAIPARAEISKHIGSMYCGPTAEVEGSLMPNHAKMFSGQSGSTSDREGQIWIGKGGSYFVVQRMKSQGLSCVVLGGFGLKKVQGPGDI